MRILSSSMAAVSFGAVIASAACARIEGDAIGYRDKNGADASAALTDATSGRPHGTSDKLDLLLVVDNSSTMGTKQKLLRQSVPALVDRLIRPRCLDRAGAAIGQSDRSGVCATGQPEFAPVHDIHVGVVTSSLGGYGSDQCVPDQGGHVDDRGHLVNRLGRDGRPSSEAAPSGFLAWLPDVPENAAKPRDPAAVGATPMGEVAKFAGELQNIIAGVGEDGCGFEAPLEAAYRFLIEPAPPLALVKEGGAVRYDGHDLELLRQRAAFLRPDSAVAVVVLTDENDASVSPLALGGRSWTFSDSPHVRPATSVCAVDPMSADCKSCAAPGAEGDPACSTPLDDAHDDINVRFFQPKRRFGVDPLFPIERYVQGFTGYHVPPRDRELAVDGAVCRNPLFASSLPRDGGDDICDLAPGPRTPDMVVFSVVAGVPWQLLTTEPGNLSKINSAPLKQHLDVDDHRRLLGADALRYDFSGQHPLMRESLEPRVGAGVDDAHTREWDTHHGELQSACTFARAPLECAGDVSCECGKLNKSPSCEGTLLVRDRATPGLRPIALARALGEQGVVASICPRESLDEASANFGYRPALNALVDRLAPSFRRP